MMLSILKAYFSMTQLISTFHFLSIRNWFHFPSVITARNIFRGCGKNMNSVDTARVSTSHTAWVFTVTAVTDGQKHNAMVHNYGWHITWLNGPTFGQSNTDIGMGFSPSPSISLIANRHYPCRRKVHSKCSLKVGFLGTSIGPQKSALILYLFHTWNGPH